MVMLAFENMLKFLPKFLKYQLYELQSKQQHVLIIRPK